MSSFRKAHVQIKNRTARAREAGKGKLIQTVCVFLVKVLRVRDRQRFEQYLTGQKRLAARLCFGI